MLIPILAAGLLLAGSLQDQTTPPERPQAATAAQDGPATELDDVLVQERRREWARTREAIRSMSLVEGANGQLARYDERDTICAAVAGFRPEQGQIVADRIAGLAQTLSLPVGEPGCWPNIYVIATADSDQAVAELLEAKPALFMRYARASVGGRNRLEDFLANDRPVRWWHLTETEAPWGYVPIRLEDGTFFKAPVKIASLFSAARQTNLVQSFVIVDMGRMESVDLVALGDYVAMTALARFEPEANGGGMPSVLSLFDPTDRAPPTEMTAFDIDYMTALYDARRDAVDAHAQESEIVARMLRLAHERGTGPIAE